MITQQIRVPNLPLDSMVDENGNATPSEMTFRQTLVTGLQKYFGNEGLVAPSQPQDATTTPPTDYVSKIQNNTIVDPTTGTPVQTLQPGTFLYDSTNDRVLVSINVAGTIVFRQITLTVPVPPIP